MLIHIYIYICRYINVKEILCSNSFFTNISKIKSIIYIENLLFI